MKFLPLGQQVLQSLQLSLDTLWRVFQGHSPRLRQRNPVSHQPSFQRAHRRDVERQRGLSLASLASLSGFNDAAALKAYLPAIEFLGKALPEGSGNNEAALLQLADGR